MATILIEVKTRSWTGLAEDYKMHRDVVTALDGTDPIYSFEVESFARDNQLWERVNEVIQYEIGKGNIVAIKECVPPID